MYGWLIFLLSCSSEEPTVTQGKTELEKIADIIDENDDLPVENEFTPSNREIPLPQLPAEVVPPGERLPKPASAYPIPPKNDDPLEQYVYDEEIQNQLPPPLAKTDQSEEEKFITRMVPKAMYAKNYQAFEDSDGRIYAQIHHDPDTVASSLADDHVILAQEWTGNVRWHSLKPKQCIFDFKIPVSQLAPDPDDLREELDLAANMTDKDREKTKLIMLSREQLYQSKHKEITFTAENCTAQKFYYACLQAKQENDTKYIDENCTDGEDQVIVHGELTIRGITRKINVKMDIEPTKSNLLIESTIRFKHSDFGFQPFVGLFGLIGNKDLIEVFVELKLTADKM